MARQEVKIVHEQAVDRRSSRTVDDTINSPPTDLAARSKSAHYVFEVPQ